MMVHEAENGENETKGVKFGRINVRRSVAFSFSFGRSQVDEERINMIEFTTNHRMAYGRL